MRDKLLRHRVTALAVALLATGCNGMTPTSPMPMGDDDTTPTVRSFRITMTAISVVALGTCDATSASGEFAIRVSITPGDDATVDLFRTDNYPGSAANPATISLQRGEIHSLNQARAQFVRDGVDGERMRIRFSATEWDTIVRVFPPSTSNVHDDSMDNRSTTRDHTFSGGTFNGLGGQSLSLGNSTCGIRLDYGFSVEPA